MNWVIQLNNSQSVNSFNSLLEKFKHVKFSKTNPTKPKPICDRSEKPEDTEHVFVVKGGNVPFPTRSMKKVCTKNLDLQIDRRNLKNCLKTSVLSMLTMEQGNLWSEAAQTHTVKEQFVPEENRDIASSNADNKFKTVQSTRRTLTSTFQECHIQQ